MTLRYLIQKEFLQIRRNAFLPRLIVLFPIMIMCVMPWVMQMEVKNIVVDVVDIDRSVESQRLVQQVAASNYFIFGGQKATYAEAMKDIEKGRADVILEIRDGKYLIAANAVNGTKGAMGSAYLSQIITAPAQYAAIPSQPSVLTLYNKGQNYKLYMIPALFAIVMMLMTGFLPTLNIVGEKEAGTIEQINVTPVGRLEFTLSKLIPYWLVGIVVLTEAILTAGLVYGLWPAGNAGTIYLAALLFALTMSGFAIAVANVSDTMQQCIFVLFFFVMIFMLMSGMLTPLESMPQWAQWLTVVFPPRWFVSIMRAVYLKGTTLAELAPAFLALVSLAVAFCSIAMLTYRKQK